MSVAAHHRVSFDPNANKLRDSNPKASNRLNTYYASDDDDDDDGDENERRARIEDEEEQERLLSERLGETQEAPSSKNKRKNEKTDQEIEAEYANASKKKRVRRTLTPNHVISNKGLIRIQKEFVQIKFPSKKKSKVDAAAAYSRNLLKAYKSFCYDLFPSSAFEDVLTRVESFGSKKEVKAYLQTMRDDVRKSHLEKVYGEEKAQRLLQELEYGLKQQQESYLGDVMEQGVEEQPQQGHENPYQTRSVEETAGNIDKNYESEEEELEITRGLDKNTEKTVSSTTEQEEETASNDAFASQTEAKEDDVTANQTSQPTAIGKKSRIIESDDDDESMEAEFDDDPPISAKQAEFLSSHDLQESAPQETKNRETNLSDGDDDNDDDDDNDKDDGDAQGSNEEASDDDPPISAKQAEFLSTHDLQESAPQETNNKETNLSDDDDDNNDNDKDDGDAQGSNEEVSDAAKENAELEGGTQKATIDNNTDEENASIETMQVDARTNPTNDDVSVEEGRKTNTVSPSTEKRLLSVIGKDNYAVDGSNIHPEPNAASPLLTKESNLSHMIAQREKTSTFVPSLSSSVIETQVEFFERQEDAHSLQSQASDVSETATIIPTMTIATQFDDK